MLGNGLNKSLRIFKIELKMTCLFQNFGQLPPLEVWDQFDHSNGRKSQMLDILVR